MKPPQIALIGTEGSGKTVLTTVLAKKLATPQDGVWLNPQGAKTGKYIENAWTTLHNGEWVPSTPAGTLFALKWTMQVQNRECPMRMIDSAGQDLRRLFSDDGFNDPNLADQDREFIRYIHDSTILLIIINLRDFLGEPDKNKVIENGFTLKGVLDKLKADKEERQIAFIFTAYDLYEETIKKSYGTVAQFIEKDLPYLHNAHIMGKPVQCFPVAAVADTEIKTDNNGRSCRVPAQNFQSKGLDPLVQWLAVVVVGDLVRQEKVEMAIWKADEDAAKAKRAAEATEARRARSAAAWQETNKSITALIWLALIIAGLWFFAPIIMDSISTCPTCEGSGTEICSNCGGDGWWGIFPCHKKCTNGSVPCSQCGGTGKKEIKL